MMAPPSKGSLLLKKTALSLVMTLLVLGTLEGGLRLIHFQYEPRQKLLWKPTVAGFVGTQEFYIQTEFAPPGYIWVSQPNTPYTDRYGFRRPELPYQKTPGHYRIAFLGGSTTQGGYRPYPERVARLLNSVAGEPRYEALNVGCSSYSTHQSLIALDRWVLPRKPDLVVVYHGWNDQLVQSDGYSDHEKDALMETAGTGQDGTSWVRRLYIARLAGRLGAWADRSWPRPRVPLARFEANLGAIATKCAEAGVPLRIVVRPESRAYPLPPYETQALAYYERIYHTTHTPDLYQAIHAGYSAAQRRVAESVPGAAAYDAWATVNRLQERKESGEFGPDVDIWQSDAIHLKPLGEELMAQDMAMALVPELKPALEAYVKSAGYWMGLAQEFLREDLPFEAAYSARRAAEADPAQKEAADALRIQAESLFEFARLFEDGRWGGRDNDFESKLRKLGRCLQIRPSDSGVLTQIFRVCLYSGKPERAADLMKAFQPANAQDQYEWLNMMLHSLLAGQRIGEAGPVAGQLLKMNPQHPQARQVLQYLQTHPAGRP